MRRTAAVIAGLAALCAAAGADVPVTPEEAVANLEKALKAASSLQARFEQFHYSMSVSTPPRPGGGCPFGS